MQLKRCLNNICPTDFLKIDILLVFDTYAAFSLREDFANTLEAHNTLTKEIIIMTFIWKKKTRPIRLNEHFMR